MTARQWTRDALDAAHPEVAAEGWAWRVERDGTPLAEAGFDRAGERNEVWVDKRGRLCHALEEPPATITIAVGLASKGLDSLGAMARAADDEAARLVPAGAHPIADKWARYGQEALQRVAAMLRGTVQG